ncbi:MAG: PorP/SprF family type IX secretion system membrane protein [Saprospiraceae bacterium]|nr:PorP/SprF family type IX secretion system membrane protein [Saprospiraceae bacterium]
MVVKKWILTAGMVLILIGLAMQTSSSQDPVFSQFYAAPLQLNPSFAGLSESPRFAAVYRNQWPLIEEPFRTYSTLHLSYDQYFDKIKSGFGFELLADNAGAGFIQSYKAAGYYSYRVELNRDGHYIKGGVEAGLVGLNYGWDKFVFGDQIDPKTGYVTPGGLPIASSEVRPADDRIAYLDVGAGLLYHSPNWFIGLSSKHLNGPSIGILNVNNSGFSGLPVRWSLHTGAQIPLSKQKNINVLSLQPALAIFNQAGFLQLNAGTQLQFNTVFVGMWYRHATQNPDALIGVLGLKKGNLKLAYSFDFTVSSLTLAQGGSHEFSLLFNKAKPPKKSYVNCFEAFN